MSIFELLFIVALVIGAYFLGKSDARLDAEEKAALDRLREVVNLAVRRGSR